MCNLYRVECWVEDPVFSVIHFKLRVVFLGVSVKVELRVRNLLQILGEITEVKNNKAKLIV